MTEREIKSISSSLADTFIANPGEFVRKFDSLNGRVTVHEGYAIGRLMDVYRRVKIREITRQEAISEQREILSEAILI